MREFAIRTYYSELEEKINVISHAIGLLLSITALALLVVRAGLYGNIWHIVSFSVYGLSLIVLYSASTFYHLSKTENIRKKLNIWDHSSIFILIAGTYTPYSLVSLNGVVGWTIFGVIWALAIAGVILKIFFIGRLEILSTIMYIAMGWLIVLAIKPLISALVMEGLVWLFAGGIFYTVGAIFFSIEKIKFNHAIFHIFVLAGSICHFISIYFYIL